MRFLRFRVQNFRNIKDSDWIDVSPVTSFVGQNEAGKSNLFEALEKLNSFYEDDGYDSTEDWPVDDWKGSREAKGKLVCHAFFELNKTEIEELVMEAEVVSPDDDDSSESIKLLPDTVELSVYRHYGYSTGFEVGGLSSFNLDDKIVDKWCAEKLPKFVLIHDYEMSGTQIELTELKNRLDKVGGNAGRLDNEDQTILIILELADIDLDEMLKKGQSSDGRTIRSFDKRAASAYLTDQFQKLWTQKRVRFEIDIDGPTLNIFAEDEVIGFPVRLKRRSTGFKWYVSFAWKFTHASKGDFENCILLLEEPGIHLHHSAQKDLMAVFDSLSKENTILYTTHLSSMVDMANPERVRIVESDGKHLAIKHGVVSSQKAPMAVIEAALGLSGDLSGMLGNRKVLIVEGGTDALILSKLSAVLEKSGKEGLSEDVYMWPAATATKVPMYAGFCVGQKWDAAALLDSDEAGRTAKRKITELYLADMAKEDDAVRQFRVLLLGESSGIKGADAAIEDLLGDKFFLECVNDAYKFNISEADLPVDGSTAIAKRVEHVLKNQYGRELSKELVLREMLKKFSAWQEAKDLPRGTAAAAEKLFKKVNGAFGTESQ